MRKCLFPPFDTVLQLICPLFALQSNRIGALRVGKPQLTIPKSSKPTICDSTVKPQLSELLLSAEPFRNPCPAATKITTKRFTQPTLTLPFPSQRYCSNEILALADPLGKRVIAG